MYEWHNKHGKSGEYRATDGYRISPDGYGILILTFVADRITSNRLNEYSRKNDLWTFEEIMLDMNWLARALFRLSFDNPIVIANKVTEMLNELINNQTQGN